MRVQAVLAVSICAALLVWLALSRFEHEQYARPASVASMRANATSSAVGDAADELQSSTPQRTAAPAAVEASSIEDELEPAFTRTVRVEVVDRHGRPASNVVVSLFEPDRGEWSDHDSTTSDATGVATLTIESDEPFETDGLWRIATPVVGCEPEFLELSLASPSHPALRLTIAESATLEVQTRTLAGAAIELPSDIALQLVSKRGQPFGIAHGWWLVGRARRGFARFEHIGLGLEFRVTARSDFADFTACTVESPRTPETKLAVALQAERLFTRVRARLQTASDRPLADQYVHVRASCADWREHSAARGLTNRAVVKSDGELEFFVEHSLLGMGPWIEFVVNTNRCARLAGRTALGPPALEDGPLERNVFDVGDVVLYEAPYFACGRVIDDDGRSIAHAAVLLIDLDAQGLERVCARTTAGEEGAFELDPSCEADEHEIRASHGDGEPSTSQKVRRGAAALVLILPARPQYGYLRGELLVAEGVNCEFLELTSELLPSESAPSEGIWLEPTGKFETSLRAPGDYTLSVSFLGTTLVRGAPFTVVQGATTELEPIDLRDQLHAFAVTITNAAGEALPDALVQIVEPDGSGGQEAESDAKGLAILTTVQRRHDLVVLAAGYRTQLVRDTVSGARIALVDGLSARLRPPELGPDATGFALSVTLWRDTREDELREAPVRLTSVDASPIDVRFSAAGHYRVAKASWREVSTGIETPIEWPPELILDVPEHGGELAFVWPVDTLRQALPRARPK
ncbi:MAG: hypothetical protein JNN27_16495 [Planctomycetes bacterium]|nr:hypothetical protein [Planctomycetota bacterium]